jgi:Long-chain acyl-CoA synthetases (AMP-forming)
MVSFIKRFEQTSRECWSCPALNNYNETTLTYGDLAQEIGKLHLEWKKAGLVKGDRIAVNSASCAGWGIVFFAAVTGGYVPCQMFPGFLPEDTAKLVNHSGSRILYTEEKLYSKMHIEDMPDVIAVFDTKSGNLLESRDGFSAIHENLDKDFKPIQAEDLHYEDRPLDDLCTIMYTSGSTGNPKGVMLTVENYTANVDVIPEIFPYRRGDNYLSILPWSHIFGLTYDLITPLCLGMHVVVLCLPPIPRFLSAGLCETKPRVTMLVPLVLAKMRDDTIGEFINSKTGRAKLSNHEENRPFANALKTIFMSALGGNVELIVTGGSALPEDLESLLIDLDIPVVTGYGMTECAPTMTLGRYGDYRKKECGIPVRTINLKINSADPQNVPGEVLVSGPVVFKGYYRNPDADKLAFTEDGWFRTGDMGVQDGDGHLFLVGRCKSMLLTTNGQNVFPEEIEVVLNQLPYVAESLIVQRGNRFVALIVPKSDDIANDSIDAESLNSIMESNIVALNKKIPAYAAVSGFELEHQPLAKTPKGSIKRFLYS